MEFSVTINTPRFLLRPLHEDDANERYLGWLNDSVAKKYITAASHENSISDLRKFIAARENRNDVLFLGIFDVNSGLHIGNIKYEPVDSDRGYAIMGILIGDVNFRGKGVAGEVISESFKWLNKNRNISQIFLGVHAENASAVKAYQNLGFVLTDTPHIINKDPKALTMMLEF